MVADVPLGAFLSGGVDSATVVALMQRHSARPVQCFTIGFDDMPSEVEDARAMAAHLGADHHAEVLTGQAARDLLTRLPAIYDEPFADPSQLPTLLVSAFARRHVTVSLSGDGADELFGGYGRHRAVARAWQGGLAGPKRRLAGLFPWLADRAALAPLGLERLAARRLRLGTRIATAGAGHPAAAYDRRVGLLDDPSWLVPGAAPLPDPRLAAIAGETGWSPLEAVGALDFCRYLPDDILVKVDRAAMAYGLETRAPFLDPEVMRLAFSLPDAVRNLGGSSKGIVKAVLARHAPRALWDRPKRGFGIPVATWLAGPFRPLLHDLLSEAALARTGVLDGRAARAVLASFEGGDRRAATLLWGLLIVQLHLTQPGDRG
jgi:asparagine synthase (glutamine-hydrolysing)